MKIDADSCKHKLYIAFTKYLPTHFKMAPIFHQLVDHLASHSNCTVENTKDVRVFGRHLAKEGKRC